MLCPFLEFPVDFWVNKHAEGRFNCGWLVCDLWPKFLGQLLCEPL